MFSAQVKLTVQGLFDLDQDISAFKEHLRDFMVQIKVCHLCLFKNLTVIIEFTYCEISHSVGEFY